MVKIHPKMRKLEDLSLEEISERASRVIQANEIDVSALVDEAIKWARKERRRASK